MELCHAHPLLTVRRRVGDCTITMEWLERDGGGDAKVSRDPSECPIARMVQEGDDNMLTERYNTQILLLRASKAAHADEPQ